MLKGSIRKRGEKFQVVFPYKNEYGEWKQRSATADTMSKAKSLLKKFNFESERIKLDNPTLAKLAELWITEISLHGSENTIRSYEKNSAFIIDRMGDVKVKDITRNDVVKLYQTIKEEGYEVKAYKGCFNMMMGYAVKSKYIDINPGKGISTSRTKEKRPARILSRTERINLLKKVQGTKYYYLVFLLLKTGLRMGEALGLSWKAINLKQGYLDVEQQYLVSHVLSKELKSKNSKRRIYLDEETVKMLKELKMSPFTSFDLIFGDLKTIRNDMRILLYEFDATPHDLRHNHGTDLLGIANIADAAARMGHTVEEYVRTYVHPSEETQKKIAEKMNSETYTLCDKFVTEDGDKVVKMADINASRNPQD